MRKHSALRVSAYAFSGYGPAMNSCPTPSSLTALIESFQLSLDAEGKAMSTSRGYVDATVRLAAWLTEHNVATWNAVTKKDLQAYMVWFMNKATRPDGKPYKMGYANNQYRAIQQFWKWWADEEDRPNPMLGMKPPRPDEEVVPVFDPDKLAELLHQAEKGRDFESRRDTALLRLFACTGLRLSELTMILIADIDLANRTVLVMGKGRQQRQVRFDAKTTKALDRYIRGPRVEHKMAGHKRLWLAVKNRGPLTPNGMRQIIERRGAAVGIDIHPHMFRHDFTHRWLDAGGAEGDLMELNGWKSPQMLRRYGRSARAARARRAYDRINVLGDI